MLGYGGPKTGSARAAIEAMAQRIRVSRGGSIVLTTATPVLVPFNVEQYENGITHSTVTDPEDITIETTGYYLITAVANYAITDMTSQAARALLTRVLVNGADVAQNAFSLAGFTTAATNDTSLATPVSDVRLLTAGDVVNLEVSATFGSGSVAVVAGATGCYMAIHRLS